jgi:hypothetical protein
MRQRVGAFDVWVYRKDSAEPRYLLLHTSQDKADRWFNGGRFWQIPSDFVSGDESIVQAARRCLQGYGLPEVSLWAAEHTYTIYNRRYEELQLILVLAAEASGSAVPQLTWEHSEFCWCTASECERLLGFRGLKEGLFWVRRYVSEAASPLPELRLS